MLFEHIAGYFPKPNQVVLVPKPNQTVNHNNKSLCEFIFFYVKWDVAGNFCALFVHGAHKLTCKTDARAVL